MREPIKRRGGADANMDLPAGKTCGDCYHFQRCYRMFGHIAADEGCDWSPSRFHEKPKKEAIYSMRDDQGRLYVDCSECNRGGNGSDEEKCGSGWLVKRSCNSGCFNGELLSGLTVAGQEVQ